MIIRCPKCQFEQEIESSVIPATAVMATCPRCGTRFQFRTLNPPEPEPESPSFSEKQPVSNGAKPHDEAVERHETTPPTPSTFVQGDDPLPPGAIVTSASGEQSLPDISDKPGKGVGTESLPNMELLPVPQAEPEARKPHPAKAKAEQEEKKENPEQRPQSESLLYSRKDPFSDLPKSDIPWELPKKYGYLNGLYQTILQVMFHPVPFFSSLPYCRGRLVPAVLFYIMLGVFQTLVSLFKLFWMRDLASSMTELHFQELFSPTSTSMTILFAPGVLLLQLYFYTALFFLMLRLVEPERTKFPVVLRVIAYSSAPMLVCAIPLVGPLISTVWFAACCFMGCRFALKLSWNKVALALGPLYLIAFAVSVQLVQKLFSL